jgi:hypothetical protein
MSGNLSIGAPVNKPYEVLKQSLKPYLTEIVGSDESAQPESKPTNESKTRTSFGIQNSLQRLDGDNLWDGKLTFGAEKNGTHAEFAFGYGQVASANLKAGHEFRWGDFGLDLSATASARKATADKIESMKNEIKTEANVFVVTPTFVPVDNNEQGQFICDGPVDDSHCVHSSQTTEFTVYNKYKPSDIEAGLEVMGTYRPTKGVKLGLGGKAVYSMPTTPDTKYHDVGYTESIINVQVDNPTQGKPENVSLVQGCSLGEITFEHDRTPKVSFRGLANAEIDLTKDGNSKATLELETGKKVMFGIKRFF